MVPSGFPGKCHLPGRLSPQVLVDLSKWFSYSCFLNICAGFWLPIVNKLSNSHHFSIGFPSMDVPLGFLKV